ncbi:DUF6259 domain-containing protein [Cohnella sp. JJ-181]|uniref:DUF6259 domain-containing protein n=1 Tax=Cohnella rhizoplanae TaxID=2974897 RepID=UPI0022FF68F4|nr:DUF6259 domain-containing protein [Cohnella sp. JJ-181]CAI6083898.1 hypothetical protein COHCIP112018_04163 [Cohnella sp. JJ-181]
MIVLENERLRLTLDARGGAIRGLRDLGSGIDYIADTGGAPAVAFRLETDEGFEEAFEAFEWSMAGEAAQGAARGVSLVWRTAGGITVRAEIELAAGEETLRFRCRADNPPHGRLHSLEYPVFPDLAPITAGGERDYIAHPFATGVLVRNPMAHFSANGAGLRYMPYPECFSGASMQFFAYWGAGRGGLYFAALDGNGHPKWLNFYKNGGGLLEASFIHGCEDIGPAKGIAPPYEVQAVLLGGEGWHEAADRYREWAERQPWCAKGKLADREDEDGAWLHRDMGAATFGINAGSDRTAWLHAYHARIRTPMFHVLGPDWTRAPQTFGSGVPGGMADWFPTRFNRANLDVMQQYGDKYAPFEFDYLYHFEGADGELGRAAAQRFPDNKKSIDAYRFPFLCPAHPYAHDFHVRRDAELARTVDVDAIYYDISANNILKVCMDESHGHPVGAGRAIEEAYRRNYADTKAAMGGIAGRYVPMGTEMMNETMLGLIDFYQARAGGQPAAPLELYPLRDLIKSGDAELIPLFAYVYHDYGILRLDGWGKLAREIGDLYYYTVARTYLWGGLYELNYEYSPMESLDGAENAPEEHYYTFEPRGYAFDDARADYLGVYARLRVGAANKYWAFGRMLRPLAFEPPRLALDWFHYNHGTDSPEYNDAGTLTVDAVVHAAWRYKEDSVGLFFANASGDPQRISARLDPADYGMTRIEVSVHGAETTDVPMLERGPDGSAKFAIPARSILLIELSGPIQGGGVDVR